MCLLRGQQCQWHDIKKFQDTKKPPKHVVNSHANYFDSKFVKRSTDFGFGFTNIDKLLMESDDDKKDHIGRSEEQKSSAMGGPHILGADDCVEILEIEEDRNRYMNIDDLLKSSDDKRDQDDSVIILDYDEEDSDELSQGDPYRSTEARSSSLNDSVMLLDMSEARTSMS